METFPTGELLKAGSWKGACWALFFSTSLLMTWTQFFCDNSSLKLYADDITLYVSNSSPNLLEIKIKKDLISISHWLTLSYLTANSTKTKAIILGSCDTFPIFMLQNEAIGQKECLTLLGVTIDSTLSMNLHIKNTLNKVYAKLSAIQQIKNVISIETAAKLYKAFVLPHFEYCSPLLLGITNRLRDKLEKANSFGLRSIFKLPHDSACKDALKTANLQTLEHWRLCHSLSLAYQALVSERGPKYIRDHFQVLLSRYNLRGGNLRLAQPISNSKWTHKSFTYLVTRMWNNLPTKLRQLDSINKFKKAITKTNLISGTLCKCNTCEQ